MNDLTPFLDDGGEMGARVRAHDWSTSPLGPPETWPRSLLSVVSLMHSSRFPMFLAWGPELCFLYNDAYAEILGNKHPGALGRPFKEIWSEIWTDILPFIETALSGRATWVENLRFVMNRFGGSEEAYFTFSYSPAFDDDGGIVGMFCACTETTTHVLAKRRREALFRLDERLREVSGTVDLSHAASKLLGEALGASRVGYGVIEPEAGIITVERNWSANGRESVSGTYRFDEYGSYIENLRRGEPVAVEDVETDPRTATNIEAMRAIGVRAFLDVPVVENGRTVAQFFVHSATPRTWADEEIAFVREFAERTRAALERSRNAAALRESEARLRLLDAISRGTAPLLDAEEILAVTTRLVGEHMAASNCAYADMDADADADGFTIRGDWAAPGSSSIVGHYSLAAFGRMTVRNLKAGEPLVINDNLSELDPGEAAAFQSIGIGSTICMPLVKGGRLTALMAVHHKGPHAWTGDELNLVREVTERSWAHVERAGAAAELKRSAQQLTVLNADLEERVRERTAELMATEETLRQSQKMEAVGQLTGGLAHDFNNLLAGIQGSLEMMRAQLADGRTDRIERYLGGALDASKRAAALTHRLLAFSRRQTLDPKPSDANRLVGEMEDLVRRTVGPAIEVDVITAPALWPVLVDPNQLENALLNLCINSRDAMPDGGRLTVETANRPLEGRAARERDLPPGEYVVLSVSDNGCGMMPEVIERAFDPFFTTKPTGLGTGLGLSMIYGFARQSGGQARIHSTPGFGTTVSIYLPRHGEAEAAPSTAPTALRASEDARGRTVLVVDDEALVRMLIVDAVEELGMTVIEAADGSQALRVLHSGAAVDLLVTDVGLPNGMNGRQVADAARETRPVLPVLFVTGYAESAVLGSGGLGHGMEVIAKPFDVGSLAERIGKLASRSGGIAGGPAADTRRE